MADETGPSVTVMTVAPRATAVIAAATTWQEFPTLWRRLLDQVYACVRDRAGTRQGANVMLYKDDVPNVEIGVELLMPCPLEYPVVASTLPAGPVAMAVHRGSYDSLGSTHQTILQWCAAHRRDLAGPRWEIYGDWRENPTELQTEIYYQLR